MLQCCRTNVLSKRIELLDDPLQQKLDNFNEQLADIPQSQDPYYLRDFQLRRKREKAARMERIIAAKLLKQKQDHLKKFHTGPFKFKPNGKPDVYKMR